MVEKSKQRLCKSNHLIQQSLINLWVSVDHTNNRRPMIKDRTRDDFLPTRSLSDRRFSIHPHAPWSRRRWRWSSPLARAINLYYSPLRSRGAAPLFSASLPPSSILIARPPPAAGSHSRVPPTGSCGAPPVLSRPSPPPSFGSIGTIRHRTRSSSLSARSSPGLESESMRISFHPRMLIRSVQLKKRI